VKLAIEPASGAKFRGVRQIFDLLNKSEVRGDVRTQERARAEGVCASA